MTRTPTLQTRQNWHNHLPNNTIVFFRLDSSIEYLLEFIFLSLSLSLSLSVSLHDVTHYAAF
jgi:hypothetical protein